MIDRPHTKAEPTPTPNVRVPEPDNPDNPRGVASCDTSGAPDAQATDAQKIQNPEPQRIPIDAAMFPDPNLERVSAGQNRKPIGEVIP